MQKRNWKYTLVCIRKRVLNKYVVTIIFFACMLTFCGENSWLNQMENKRQISALEEELDNYQQQAAQYKRDIEVLRGNTDNIERYAREHYYMHAPNEDVYLIDEE